MLDTTLLDKIIVGRVEPHIYAFSTNTIPNYLKVGDTYRPVSERLREWRVCYPNLEPQYDAKALINDEVYFRDFSVHQYLETEKKRVRLATKDIPQGVYFSKEFFKEASSADVQEAIKDIEKDYSDHTHKYHFYNTETLIPVNTKFPRTETYELRPNQKETVSAFKTAIANGRKNLLMYAVMRFGKSFTSMCCAVEMGANIVVVVSAKADVLTEWQKTVESHVKFIDYDFLTKDVLRRNAHAITETLNKGKKVVVFLTLQDLQGKTIKDKHQEVFGQDIDLLLVDETHFGARAEKYGLVLNNANKYEKDKRYKEDNDDFVDIDTANETIKTLKANVTIHLSGTPYRILMGSEFKKEDIIAFYQFTDIVKDQKKWDNERILDDSYKEWDNPYYGFPQMVRFAFCPNESSRKCLEELKKSGTTYAFSALFKPKSINKANDGSHKKFIYEKEILDLLEVIDGSKSDDEVLGFLDYKKLKEGQMCRHIVIVLPYRASCDALEELIKRNRDKFRNLSTYEIINVSGVDDPGAYKTPETIKAAITQCERNGEKTITLTVKRMLTGSTVPEWDTMIYLNDTASPQEYDQAIFRLQNQYIKTCTDDKGDIIKINLKPQTLLVDFDPSRMFAMQEQKSKIFNANKDIGGNSELKRRMDLELRFSPIIVINGRKVEQVCATDILQVISNYKLDKGIREEAIEISVDLGILEDPIIRAVIEGENEIGSGKGIALPAHRPLQGSGDGEQKTADGEEPFEKPEIPDNTEEDERKNTNTGKDDGGDKDSERVLKKKIQSYYARILLFAFLTKDCVISLADIIEKLDKEENPRIAGNLGLDKSVLRLIESIINKFVLSELDYKIQDINELSHDTQKSPAQKVTIAIHKFGKLGDAIVTTPANICDDMINLLPQEFIESLPAKCGKVLDIAGTCGEYAVALYKRMIEAGLDKDYIAKAIYTIPKSTISYELVRRIYEMLGLNTQNIAKNFNAFDLLTIKRGEEIDYERINFILTQDKPFEEITLQNVVWKGDKIVKFDAIVGNPPYQEKDGGAQASSKPIYNIFVNIAKRIDSKYISIIMPTRWYAGGKGLDNFRKEMLIDKHIVELHDYIHPEEIFPNTNNRGGICYFLRDSNYNNMINGTKVFTHKGKGEVSFSKRSLKIKDIDIFLRYKEAISILNKVVKKSHIYINQYISSRKPFGIESQIIKTNEFKSSIIDLKDPIKCYGKNKRIGYVESNLIPCNIDWIQRWKIFLPRANNIGTELNDDNLNAFVGEPNSICTEAYLFFGIQEGFNQKEANNSVKYFHTKFVRFLHSLAKASHDATSKTYRFIPLQDFTEKSDIDWSKSVAEIDKLLYEKYKLSKDEKVLIDKMIKPME